MPKPVDLKTVIRVLERHGFVLISQRGSHAKFRRRNETKRTVIVKTTKKQIPYGTLRSILSQSGLNESAFRYDEK